MKSPTLLRPIALVCVLLAAPWGTGNSLAEPVPAVRTALLMGVWDYEDDTFPKLPKTGIQNDLVMMKEKLSEMGFQVTVVENPSLKQAKNAVDDFGATLKARGGASLFYFTGHGSEHEGKNFLIPVGTDIQASGDLDDEALSANRVLERMEASGIEVNLVFLDCCRNSLSKGGITSELAPMTARGALIGYATRSGDVAEADESGSPYTKALVKHLGQPGLSLSDMHTKVTKELLASGSKRRPGQYVDLGDVYHFFPPGAAVSSMTPSQVPSQALAPAQPPPLSPRPPSAPSLPARTVRRITADEFERTTNKILQSGKEIGAMARDIQMLVHELEGENQVNASRHLVNLTSDEDYALISAILLDSGMNPDVLEVLFSDLINRKRELQLPMLMNILRDSKHPLNENVRNVMTILAGQDHGNNFAAWDAWVQTELKKAPGR